MMASQYVSAPTGSEVKQSESGYSGSIKFRRSTIRLDYVKLRND